MKWRFRPPAAYQPPLTAQSNRPARLPEKTVTRLNCVRGTSTPRSTANLVLTGTMAYSAGALGATAPPRGEVVRPEPQLGDDRSVMAPPPPSSGRRWQRASSATTGGVSPTGQ